GSTVVVNAGASFGASACASRSRASSSRVGGRSFPVTGSRKALTIIGRATGAGGSIAGQTGVASSAVTRGARANVETQRAARRRIGEFMSTSATRPDRGRIVRCRCGTPFNPGFALIRRFRCHPHVLRGEPRVPFDDQAARLDHGILVGEGLG